MHFLIAAFGGAGDVLPLITTGAHLLKRKNRVTMIAHVAYKNVANRSGLEFISLSSAEGYEASLHDTHLLMTRYTGIFLRRYAVEWNRVLQREITRSASRDLVVVASDRPHIWADLLLNREKRIPTIRVRIDLPWIPGSAQEPNSLPPSMVQTHLTYALQKEWIWGDDGRPSASFSQLPRLIYTGRRSVPDVALWPPWLVPAENGPRGIVGLGFVPPPSSRSSEENIAIREALAAVGSRYVISIMGTEGTTREWARHFIRVSIDICRNLDCGGIFLGAEPENLFPSPVLPRLCFRKFLPLEGVLSGALAIVHHGGVGTASMAALHGIPQLMVPRLSPP